MGEEDSPKRNKKPKYRDEAQRQRLMLFGALAIIVPCAILYFLYAGGSGDQNSVESSSSASNPSSRAESSSVSAIQAEPDTGYEPSALVSEPEEEGEVPLAKLALPPPSPPSPPPMPPSPEPPERPPFPPWPPAFPPFPPSPPPTNPPPPPSPPLPPLSPWPPAPSPPPKWPPAPPPPPPPPPSPAPPPPAPNVCVAEQPCGENAVCEFEVHKQVHKKSKRVTYKETYTCSCIKGYKGDPYTSGKDKCRDEHELYLEELFGMNKCYGCRYEPALYGTYNQLNISTVLDVGTGACGVVRSFITHGLKPKGVEAVSFPLEDRCADLLEQDIVQKAPLDQLPFDDHSFDLVTSFNTLEYIPRDNLDGVIAEIVRTATTRVFVTVQLPDWEDINNLGAGDMQPENFFPKEWWIERFEAHGLMVSDMRQAMYEVVFENLRTMTKKTKKAQQPPLAANEAVFLLTRQPKVGSASARASEREQCVGCSYMPLVYNTYAPRSGPDRSRFHMQDSLVIGPSACNVVRGMMTNPPIGLKSVHGVARNEFIVEMGCPDLHDEKMVDWTDGPNPDLSMIGTGSSDLVMSFFDLEYLPEHEVSRAIQELARVAERRLFVTIHTCGNRILSPTCRAAQIPEIQTVRNRQWWKEIFEANGLQVEWLSKIFEKRACEVREDPSIQEMKDRKSRTRDEADPYFYIANDDHRQKLCESLYDQLKFASQHELVWQDIFPLKRITPHPSPPPPPQPDVSLEEDDQALFPDEWIPPPPAKTEEQLEDELEGQLDQLQKSTVVKDVTEMWNAKKRVPPPSQATLATNNKVAKLAERGYMLRAAGYRPEAPPSKPATGTKPRKGKKMSASDKLTKESDEQYYKEKSATGGKGVDSLHKMSREEHVSMIDDRKAALKARIDEEQELHAKMKANPYYIQRERKREHEQNLKDFQERHGLDLEAIQQAQDDQNVEILKKLKADAEHAKRIASKVKQTGKMEHKDISSILKHQGEKTKYDEESHNFGIPEVEHELERQQHEQEEEDRNEEKELVDVERVKKDTSISALEKEFGKLSG